jgi:hypothetical protein
MNNFSKCEDLRTIDRVMRPCSPDFPLKPLRSNVQEGGFFHICEIMRLHSFTPLVQTVRRSGTNGTGNREWLWSSASANDATEHRSPIF